MAITAIGDFERMTPATASCEGMPPHGEPRLFPGVGGVHLVEAVKSLYAAAPPPLPVAAKVALKPAQDLGS